MATEYPQQGIARLFSMTNGAVSASQAQEGGLLELTGHSIRLKADLLQQASGLGARSSSERPPPPKKKSAIS
jgi:hypothetical protein